MWSKSPTGSSMNLLEEKPSNIMKQRLKGKANTVLRFNGKLKNPAEPIAKSSMLPHSCLGRTGISATMVSLCPRRSLSHRKLCIQLTCVS